MTSKVIKLKTLCSNFVVMEIVTAMIRSLKAGGRSILYPVHLKGTDFLRTIFARIIREKSPKAKTFDPLSSRDIAGGGGVGSSGSKCSPYFQCRKNVKTFFFWHGISFRPTDSAT